MAEQFDIVALVTTADLLPRPVHCSKKPHPQEFNLLFVLCEHVGRIISIDDICHRMKSSPNSVRICACRLRKKLSHEWVIESVSNKGMRIIYNGGRIVRAERTRLEIQV